MTLSGAPAHCSDSPKYQLISARAIRFLPCGVVSYHLEDVRNHYCARCHRFIDDWCSGETGPQQSAKLS